MDVREKLVEMLKKTEINKINGHTALAEACFTPNVFENMATNLIANGVTVQEWISVKDRLPNLDEAVLVLAEYLHIKTNYYEAWSLFKCESGETIWVDKYGNGHNLTEVTYWMPLPSAPKGETI